MTTKYISISLITKVFCRCSQISVVALVANPHTSEVGPFVGVVFILPVSNALSIITLELLNTSNIHAIWSFVRTIWTVRFAIAPQRSLDTLPTSARKSRTGSHRWRGGLTWLRCFGWGSGDWYAATIKLDTETYAFRPLDWQNSQVSSKDCSIQFVSYDRIAIFVSRKHLQIKCSNIWNLGRWFCTKGTKERGREIIPSHQIYFSAGYFQRRFSINFVDRLVGKGLIKLCIFL